MTQGSDRISEDELKELFDCEALDALNTGSFIFCLFENRVNRTSQSSVGSKNLGKSAHNIQTYKTKCYQCCQLLKCIS